MCIRDRPYFLLLSEHRALRHEVGTRYFDAIATGLVTAILPAVEHDEVGERTEWQCSIELLVGTFATAGLRHGHPLVMRLIGCGSPLQKTFAWLSLLGDLTS